MKDKIIIKGAREHNLKDIDIEIPRNKFVVITGVSGSGKSTLAFDTIYAEGQRRYVESLSSYARQFLGLMEKPDVDLIDGLSPAISIEQKTTSKNPRSTVGTVTEIYDYLRLIYARIGIAHCPICSRKIMPTTVENIVNEILKDDGKKIAVLSPVVSGKKGTYEKLFEKFVKDGFTKVRVNSVMYNLDTVLDEIKLDRYENHFIEVVVDRLIVNAENKQRLYQAVEHSVEYSDGKVIILDVDMDNSIENKDQSKKIEEKKQEKVYSTFGSCPVHHDIVFQKLEPRMFSFNSPFGACPTCLGLGEIMKPSEDLIIPDKSKSILEGAIAVYGKMDNSWRITQMAAIGKAFGFDVTTPIEKFTKEQYDILMYGMKKPIKSKWETGAVMRQLENGWEGLINQTERLFYQTESEYRKDQLNKFFKMSKCPTCLGKRLKDTILAVKLNGKSIIELTDMSISDLLIFFKELSQYLDDKDNMIAKQVLKEINDRLGFLESVGIGYLTLSRKSATLSGGESQRIRLATQIGSNLTGVLYILDEPSIGLHQSDNRKLISTLIKLRDIGNTLIVVEHDEETMLESDYIIDMGPGAGLAGGNVCAKGTPQEIIDNENSLTGDYLSKRKQIIVKNNLRKINEFIEIRGAVENNLKNVDVKLPTKVFCCITGVSGSGKSTLINQTLVPALKKHMGMEYENMGKHDFFSIPKDVTNMVVIDQSPIGKTPRSNPATYIKVFDDIRNIFANSKEAKIRGYDIGRFSFNVKGGRCEKCMGDGIIKIEMNFLPDVYVKCEECNGLRYNSETLSVKYNGKSIADVLDMDVATALEFFNNHPSIKRKLSTLNDVGLGYIKLGQSSTTLSGGESQRIKLTKELAKFKKGHTIYVLDEPTTGLHFDDVKKLIDVLERLVDKGNSVFVIEHNLDVVKNADYIIDLGPKGGDNGGKIIAQGTVEQVSNIKGSLTGKFLKEILDKEK